MLITNYETLRADFKVLARVPWHCLVVDEAQRIKGCASALRADLLRVPHEHAVLLTGTPIQNRRGRGRRAWGLGWVNGRVRMRWIFGGIHSTIAFVAPKYSFYSFLAALCVLQLLLQWCLKLYLLSLSLSLSISLSLSLCNQHV